MTANTLHLHIDRADGSLQRLIGLVERRGFHIDGLSLCDEGSGRRVEIAVRGRDAAKVEAAVEGLLADLAAAGIEAVRA